MPGPVIGPGLLATMRRTSGLSALATPGTIGRGSGTSASSAAVTASASIGTGGGGGAGRQQLVAGGEAADVLEAHDGGADHGEVAGPVAARARRRAHPLAADELAVVVGVGLALGRPGEEEPGVEALGLALRA